MKYKPLVSVIVTTKNEEKNIENFCKSVKDQSYENIELIVVDNNSTDKTKEIAKRYTDKVFNKGPERSAQRNYGVEVSRGDFVLILDADMVLNENVVKECVDKIVSDSNIVGLIIPEISTGKGFWAKCRKLEKEFYQGSNEIEASRFYKKDIFTNLGGFDTHLISGEDWDLSTRAKKMGKIDRVSNFIKHNDGTITLFNTLKKKFYYGKNISKFTKKPSNLDSGLKQVNLINRYKLFFSNPKKLFSNPIVGIGLVFLKSLEFISIMLGLLYSDPKEGFSVILRNLNFQKNFKARK